MICRDIQQSRSQEPDHIDQLLEYIESCDESADIHNTGHNDDRIIEHFDDNLAVKNLNALNQNVMARIYSENTDLMPVTKRNYFFSNKLRRNIFTVITCFLSIFVASFVYLATTNFQSSEVEASVGMMPTTLINDNSDSFIFNLGDIPTASISDPLILNMISSYPFYWIALSLFGIIVSLLILNWLTRVKR